MSTIYAYNKSVRQGLKILELLSEQGALSDKQVSDRLNYNLLTVQQILSIYNDAGYIVCDHDGCFDLSIKVIEISRKFQQRSEVKDIARKYLKQLSVKYNETTTLGAIEETNVIYVDKINSMELIRFVPHSEQKITAHHTALGKSILASLPVNEIHHYCNCTNWKQITHKTIDSKEKLLIRLEQIRKQGFAICDEEYYLGLRSVAVPILDSLNYPRFSIGIWGPVARMIPAKLRQMQIDLTDASLQISKYYTKPSRREEQFEPAAQHTPVKRKKRKKPEKSLLEKTLSIFL